MDDRTEKQVGAIEVLLSSFVCSVTISVFSGQPLTIVGVTGPVSILTVIMYELAEKMDFKFMPFYAMSQLWGCLFIVLLAVFNVCDTVKYISDFACEIFGLLIGAIFFVEGVIGLSHSFTHDYKTREGDHIERKLSDSLFEAIICIGTAYMSIFLNDVRKWNLFNETVRNAISDYCTTIVIIFWSLVAYLFLKGINEEGHRIPMLYLPDKFETTSGREWFVDFSELSGESAMFAIIPGLIIAVLFYFDHNISTRMARDKQFNLEKPAAYHLDMLWLGLLLLITGLLGLPPTNGMIPMSPLHSQSLQYKKKEEKDVDGVIVTTQTNYTLEQRWTNCCQGLLCGLGCIYPFTMALKQIPTSALYGIFIFLGYASFDENPLGFRLIYCLVQPDLREKYHNPQNAHWIKTLEHNAIFKYTMLQFACVMIILGLTFCPPYVSISFPLLIMGLIYLRQYLNRVGFDDGDLDLLDPMDAESDVVGGDKLSPVPQEDVEST